MEQKNLFANFHEWYPKRTVSFNFINFFVILAFHLVAVLAFLNWSLAGFIVFLFFYVASAAGITVGYHRLLTHQSFKSNETIKRIFVILGVSAFQGGPLNWVAEHRLHHRESDKELDPHNIFRGFFYAHMGWLFRKNDAQTQQTLIDVFAPDLKKDSFLVWAEKYNVLIASLFGVALLLLGGWKVFLWGFVFRVVFVWHVTWFVNSASHLWGYRHWTTEMATNCWWVGLLALGEGWHNAHHALPTSARHGLRWWEFDFSWCLIKGFESLGWVSKIKLPKAEQLPWKPEYSSKPIEMSAIPVQSNA
jgi:fatty-acid desaturase